MDTSPPKPKSDLQLTNLNRAVQKLCINDSGAESGHRFEQYDADHLDRNSYLTANKKGEGGKNFKKELPLGIIHSTRDIGVKEKCITEVNILTSTRAC